MVQYMESSYSNSIGSAVGIFLLMSNFKSATFLCWLKVLYSNVSLHLGYIFLHRTAYINYPSFEYVEVVIDSASYTCLKFYSKVK